jgi:uncharacterized protein
MPLSRKENNMVHTQTAGTVSEARISSFLAKVYLLMTLGLAVTALVSTWVSTNQMLLLRLNTNPWIAFGLFILQIMLVAAISGAAMRMAPGAALLLFIVYSGLMGLTLSAIFLVYTQETIAQVFWITALTFLLSGLVGLLLKRDLSSAGGVLMMLLFGWMIAWIFSWLFPYSSFSWAMTYLGIALFVGLTAWDTNRLKQIGAQMDDHPAKGGLIVVGALMLYLDFINLFLLILRASRR